jgi:hypothetical protein
MILFGIGKKGLILSDEALDEGTNSLMSASFLSKE